MLKEVLIFTGGALVGAACTYLAIKGKYERQSKEEIDELRKMYLDKCRKVDEIHKLEERKEELKDIIVKTQAKIVNDYLPNSETEEPDEEEDEDEENIFEAERIPPVEHPKDPYTISPDKFAYENRHYDKVTLLYYPQEDVLTNELYDYPEDQEDVDMTIGRDALTKFGEFEEDVVYVRNDRIGIDYEVILQPDFIHYIFMDEEE